MLRQICFLASILISDASWYVPYYNPNLPQQTILGGNKRSRAQTDSSYLCVSVEDVDAQIIQFFDLRVKRGLEVPIHVKADFKMEVKDIVYLNVSVFPKEHILNM